MQKDNTPDWNIVMDEGAILEIISLSSEDFSTIIYAIGCPEFEESMQKWSKNILTQIIKENNKAQDVMEEEKKGCPSPPAGRRSENTSTNNELSKLFENNLKELMTDLDWEEIARRFQSDLDLSNHQSENTSKKSKLCWSY